MSISSCFGDQLCSRPLKHGNPWRSGTKYGGGCVTSREEGYQFCCIDNIRYSYVISVHPVIFYVENVQKMFVWWSYFLNNWKRLRPLSFLLWRHLFPGFCLRGREPKVPDFKSELLANDKSESDNFFRLICHWSNFLENHFCWTHRGTLKKLSTKLYIYLNTFCRVSRPCLFFEWLWWLAFRKIFKFISTWSRLKVNISQLTEKGWRRRPTLAVPLLSSPTLALL